VIKFNIPLKNCIYALALYILVTTPLNVLAYSESEFLIDEGIKALDSGDLDTSYFKFYSAVSIDPLSSEAWLYLGILCYQEEMFFLSEKYLWNALRCDHNSAVGNVYLADLYRSVPFYRDAMIVAESCLLRVKTLKPDWSSVTLRLARLYQGMGNIVKSEEYYEKYLLQSPHASPSALLETGNFYFETGNLEQARISYQQVLRIDSTDEFCEEARVQLLKLDVLQSTSNANLPPSRKIDESILQLLSEGYESMREGGFSSAKEKFLRAQDKAPFHAEPLIALGDYYLRQNQIDNAEKSYIPAVVYAPDNAYAKMQLGLLYYDFYGGKLDFEAVELLDAALDLRPDWVEILYFKGKALARMNQYSEALNTLQSFVEVAPNGYQKSDAQRLIFNLKRRSPELPVTLSCYSNIPHYQKDSEPLPPEIRRWYGMVMGYLERDAFDMALETLDNLIMEWPIPEWYNLKARLFLQNNDVHSAITSLQASIELSPDQPEILEQNGNLYYLSGDFESAIPLFKAALEQGQKSSLFHLAHIYFESQEYFKAYTFVSDYLDVTVTGLHVAEAQQMLRDLKIKIFFNVSVILLVFIVALGAIIFVFLKKRNRVNLEELASLDPGVFPELIRIVSSLHHEVLKHNTTVLNGMAEILKDDVYPIEKIDYCLNRLTGDNGIIEKFAYYLDCLKNLARKNGKVLAVHSDDMLVLLISGFRHLKACIPVLNKIKKQPLKSLQRQEFIRLQKTVKTLNDEAYFALKTFLNGMLQIAITAEMVNTIFDRVSKEPALLDVEFKGIEISIPKSETFYIQIPRIYLEDILSNLIRNAIQSAVEYECYPVEIGCEVTTIFDPVTFIERIVIRVLDRSPEILTNEIIRGRYIGDGLGLTVDLVGKYNGSIEVQTGWDKWKKAVCVIFKRSVGCMDDRLMSPRKH